ncbi:MAG TPA: AAA family ATPase [Pyrinomonadaceae bacterium]|nr:AAA family ATPase [Pyrinomonadaceae bacterium]
MNIILGGGDVGKTTILDAIALLLHPTNTYPLSGADYWQRKVESEFVIEAVMSLSDVASISQASEMNWPWHWDGDRAVLPPETNPEEIGNTQLTDPVHCLRIRGTAELETAYEVVQPNLTITNFSVGLRRSIGLIRLAGDDRNDRDLRLVQGSALDRLLQDKGLRARLGYELSEEDVRGFLNDKSKTILSGLESTFKDKTLPSDLGLGITGGPGLSINALVGLTAKKDDVSLPLSNWGSGTRRLAALAIAAALQDEHPITVVDEIEKGLEPYRQRKLVESLTAGGAQVFLTTHGPSVLSAASDAGVWYLDTQGALGTLASNKVGRHLKSDPETFLSRLAVVCEGATELGFAEVMLTKGIGDLLAQGIHLTDGGGHICALQLLEGLAEGGLTFAGVVDTEGQFPGRWAALKQKLGDLLIQWPNGCLEEHVIPLFNHTDLLSVIKDPEGEKTGLRLRCLAERLAIDDASYQRIEEAAGASLRQVIVEASSGKIPDDSSLTADDKKRMKGWCKSWFKTEEGGRELARKIFDLGVWPALRSTILPFVNEIRKTLGEGPIGDITP